MERLAKGASLDNLVDNEKEPLLAGSDEHDGALPGNTILAGLAFIAVVGLVFGFAIPSSLDGQPAYISYISGIIGWTYFAAWSVSFYPQVYTNWKRKCVIGLSFDYQLLNLIGFTFYSIFNLSFFCSNTIQTDYEAQHDGHKNVVQANDVFFALHAATITAITCFQCFVYERGGQTLSKLCIIGSTIALATTVVYFVLVLARHKSGGTFTMLNWLYWLSYVKLAISISKYIPQVYMNYSRKSTQGWNIYNVLLDFTGGSLSVLQLCMDSGLQHDWSGVSGDPVKFGLGFCSMFFDIIFMVQHYILYNNR